MYCRQTRIVTLPTPSSLFQQELPHLSPDCDDNVVLISDHTILYDMISYISSVEAEALALSLVGLPALGKVLHREIKQTVCSAEPETTHPKH